MPYDNRDPKRDHNFDNHPYKDTTGLHLFRPNRLHFTLGYQGLEDKKESWRANGNNTWGLVWMTPLKLGWSIWDDVVSYDNGPQL